MVLASANRFPISRTRARTRTPCCIYTHIYIYMCTHSLAAIRMGAVRAIGRPRALARFVRSY